MISIGIPFHNNAHTILDAVRSVYAQTYTNWEMILVDDGSIDDSFELVASLHDPRITLLRDGENRGLAARLNQIATIAQGEHLARMDADDIMHPDRLAKQIQFAATHPEYDVIGSSLYSIDQRSKTLGARFPPVSQLLPKQLLSNAPLAHPAILGKTTWFRDNPYDESYRRCQDQELWVRTYRHSMFTNLPTPLMFVREGGDVTPGKYAKSSRATRRIIRQYGPNMIGRRDSLMMIMLSYGKESAYRVFDKFGLVNTLVNQRNSPLTPEQYLDAESAMAKVNMTLLPSEHTK